MNLDLVDVRYPPTGGFEPLVHDETAGTMFLDQFLRQRARVGTAGVVVKGGLSLEQIGTSLLAARLSANSEAERPVACHEALPLSVASQARELLAALALNKSLLAEVMNVSRPTLYDWFDGKEPNAANAERLATLLRLVARAGVTGARPLNARFVRRPMTEGDPSLLDVLRSDTLDEERVAALLREARLLTDKADELRRGREDRLRAAGYEDVSDEQRKQFLAQNIAMRDWPKT